MRSVMTHQFSQVPKANIPRSQFNRSFGHKTTFNASYLIPVYVDEALPGDTFNLQFNAFARMETLLKPVMDNIYLDYFFFAVPIRLIWDNWKKFNGEQENPDDSTDFIVPTITSPATTGYEIGSLSDYMGLPTGVPDLEHSALWHRAYALVYNEWFRDQNLIDSIPINKGDGPDLPTDYVLQKRGKRHDYFTSALPWPQKGPDVNLPLGSSAPIISDGQGLTVGFTAGTADATLLGNTNATVSMGTPAPTDGQGLFYGNRGLVTDLTTATAATINQLREAFQVQKLYERDARGGTRYTEVILSHFGVSSPDMRQQRPEYLGGGSTPIAINPIAQTSTSLDVGTAITPQGNLAAQATVNINSTGFSKSFTEHNILIGLVCARADLTYQQGLDRMFSRSTRFDFYWPALAHLGEQELLQKEIYATGDPAQDELVFGYQERWAEYRYKPSKITGQFRSTAPLSLDVWHLSQEFGNAPTLSQEFIEEDVPIDRIIAVPDQPHFIFDSYFSLKCARPMPVYSVPGLIDHF